MDAPLHIIADDRELGRGVVEALRGRNGVELEVARLAVGDYRVGSLLLVERKTIPDLGWSVRDGRVFRQAHHLLRAGCTRACLILEGGEGDLARAPITRASYDGALVTLALVYGLPVLRTRSPADSAEILLVAARQVGRREAAPAVRRSSRQTGLRRLQSQLLQAVPNLGPRKAAALLETFDTPAGVAAATCQELAAVRGLGPVLSRRLWWVLHEQPSPPADPCPLRMRP